VGNRRPHTEDEDEDFNQGPNILHTLLQPGRHKLNKFPEEGNRIAAYLFQIPVNKRYRV
jgi:hypothetical protein